INRRMVTPSAGVRAAVGRRASYPGAPPDPGDNRRMRSGKAVVLSGSISAATAIWFWTQSRIPALQEKAMMGERSAVASLSFGELLRVEEAMPLWKRIAFTAVNWGNTN